MSARIPLGSAEIWLQFNTPTDLEPMYTSLGVSLAPGTTANQVDCDAILTAAHGAIDQAISDDYTIGPSHILFGDDVGEIRVDGSGAPVNGTRSGTALPPNCCTLVRKNSLTGGRRGRGRMFWPGVSNSDVAINGTWLTGAKVVMQAAADGLRTALLDTAQVDGLELFHETAPFTPTAIASLQVQNQIATQRRRLRR